MKRMIPFFIIPMVAIFFATVPGCTSNQIDIIKFPEPHGKQIGAIQRDFDGNGHDRYLTPIELLEIDSKKIKYREIVLESRENALSWVEQLSRKNALWISGNEAISLAFSLDSFSNSSESDFAFEKKFNEIESSSYHKGGI